MKWFANLPTRSKLWLSFGLVIVLALALVATAYVGLTAVQQSYTAALDLVELRSDLNRQRGQMLEMLATTDKGRQKEIERDVLGRVQEIDQLLQRVADHTRGNGPMFRKFVQMQDALKEYRLHRATVTRQIQEGKADEAKKLALGQQEDHFEKVRILSVDLGSQAEEDAQRQVTLATVVLVLVALLAVLTTIALVLYLNRIIARPLGSFMQFAEKVGQGDLTRQAGLDGQVHDNTRNEVTKLGHSLNQMVTGLREVTGHILGVTQSLSAAGMEILASTQQQAAGTKEQAATVQEITTTMEEVNQAGIQIAQKAKQVAAAAEATSAGTNLGIQTVQDTSRTMESIREQVEEVAEHIVALSEKTQAIGEIIATVNDIAERSNLLALNAAIEAAAAGEQGNRFSVVAQEMKNLADQAKDSTVQVRTILSDIHKGINSSVMLTEEAVKRVESGRRQADATEQTIRQLARMTLESVQAFEQIIAAGNQQQIGFEQVAQGMKDIRQAANQTATATSQLEQAVANLNTLGQELKQAVGRYRL